MSFPIEYTKISVSIVYYYVQNWNKVIFPYFPLLNFLWENLESVAGRESEKCRKFPKGEGGILK